MKNILSWFGAFFWLINGTIGCFMRLPTLSIPSESSNIISSTEKRPDPDFDSEYANETEKNALLMKIQNRMLSTALQFIVDITIQTGGLEFTCPSELNGTELNANRTYADSLDCHKYYVCDANDNNMNSNNITKGNYTTKRCSSEEGFDNVTLSCVPKKLVELCELVQIDSDFACNSTGLHAYKEDCTKFVLCTKEKVAFVSSCNAGSFFDKSLLICLPSFEVIC